MQISTETKTRTFTLEDIAKENDFAFPDSSAFMFGGILKRLYDVKDLRALPQKDVAAFLNRISVSKKIVSSCNVFILPEVLEEEKRLLERLNEQSKYLRNHHKKIPQKFREKIRDVSGEERVLERACSELSDFIRVLREHIYKPNSKKTNDKLSEIYCAFEDVLGTKKGNPLEEEKFRRIPQMYRRQIPELQTDEKLCAAVLTASLENSNSSIALITRNTRHMPSLFCTAYAYLLSEQFAQENGFLFQTFNPRTRLYIPVYPESNFYLIEVSYNDIRPRSLYIKDCSREYYEEFVNSIKTKLKEASEAFNPGKHL